MPAITTTTVAGTQLAQVLQDVLKTDQSEWNSLFKLNKMVSFFSDFATQINTKNFFSVDYSIETFFEFLRVYVQSESINIKDSILLKSINSIYFECKKTILNQQKFTESEIKITVKFLQFINGFFWGPNKHLLENNNLRFDINDLSQITTYIVENRGSNVYIRNLIASYLSIMKSSLEINKFLLIYKQHDFISENIETLGKNIFLKQDSQALFTIPHFFSGLAFEINFIARSWQQLNITESNVEQQQEEIILKVTELQHFFLTELNDKHDIPEEGLKFLFFKYFLQEAIHIKDSLSKRYKNYLAYYSNEDYTPLHLTSYCSTVANNKFVIKHAGLTGQELEVICQAKACADANYGQWLDKLGVNQKQLPNGDITYHIFNASKYDADFNYFNKYETISTALYQSIKRNLSLAMGSAYAQQRSNQHNQWQTTAHEYTHHLNFVAFGNIARSLNEGLAYRLILNPCIDSGFQNWLQENYNNYTSLALLSKPGFIGYNPSTLFMSYLVDTNPSIFSEILQSYRNYDDHLTSKKINQLIDQDTSFSVWLSAYRDKCKNFTFRKLGEGDGYCPSLLANDFKIDTGQHSFRTTPSASLFTSMPSNTSPGLLTAGKLTLDEMGYQLIFTISRRKLDEFRTLLQNGANPNYLAEDTGDTPLHFLYHYGNCDVKYLELLLSYGAKVTPNLQGRLPLQIAEEHCNAIELLKIQETFAKHGQQQKLALTIVMPITSLINGFISGLSGEIAQRNSQSRYIPNIIYYGLKPATLAMSNSAINILLAGSAEALGLNDIGLSFSYYLLVNYVGLMLAQFGERITSNIENKFLNIVISILLYTFFLNPSLMITLLTEGFMSPSFQNILWLLLSLLSGGILFKAGEYSGQKSYEKFFPIHSADTINSQQDYFLRYSLDGAEKRISVEEKTLEEIKNKLEHLQKMLKKYIDEQAYILSFDENFSIANTSLLKMLSETQENQESYRIIFKTFKESLLNIQKNLDNLLEKIESKKVKSEIKLLWSAITEILPLVSQIQPLPVVNNSHDLLTNHSVDVKLEEGQIVPLMSSHPNRRYTRPPTMLGKVYNFFTRPVETESKFPDPPTHQELQAMGILTTENPRTPCQNIV